MKKIVVAVVIGLVVILAGWLVVQFGGFGGTRAPEGGLQGIGTGNEYDAVCAESCADFSGADLQECMTSCREFTQE